MSYKRYKIYSYLHTLCLTNIKVSVNGEWFEPEKSLITKLLSHILITDVDQLSLSKPNIVL